MLGCNKSNRIKQENLAPLTSYSDRAILVEAYNHILIDEKIPLNFARGIESFVSKPDLNPFALAKFLGIIQCMHYSDIMRKKKG